VWFLGFDESWDLAETRAFLRDSKRKAALVHFEWTRKAVCKGHPAVILTDECIMYEPLVGLVVQRLLLPRTERTATGCRDPTCIGW